LAYQEHFDHVEETEWDYHNEEDIQYDEAVEEEEEEFILSAEASEFFAQSEKRRREQHPIQDDGIQNLDWRRRSFGCITSRRLKTIHVWGTRLEDHRGTGGQAEYRV
jgi:hypothetical protein